MLSDSHLRIQCPRPPGRRKCSHQSGVTLIELMIVLTISIVVLAAISNAFLNGWGTQKFQSELIRTQESARFAFELLSRSIRHAGYRNTFADYPDGYSPTGIKPTEFCSTSTTGSELTAIDDPTSAVLISTLSGTTTTASILNQSDVLRVRFFGEDNLSGTAADNSVIDCFGNSIRRPGNINIATSTANPVEETFYIATEPVTGEPALYCNSTAGSTNTTAPLVPGVESMQMLFGEDTDGDGNINRYVSFNNVSNPDNVLAIMISLVIRTDHDIDRSIMQNQNRSFNQLGKTVSLSQASTLYRFRRQFSTTISLRNFGMC